MNQPYTNPFFVPNPQKQAEEEERRKLRKDATYIGIMSVTLTVVMEVAFTVLLLILMTCGVMTAEQLELPFLGMGNTSYLLMYIGVYVFVMLVPAVVVSFFCKKRFFPFSPAKPVSGPFAFLAVLAAIGLCMFTNIINSYILTVLSEMGLEIPEAPQMMVNTTESFLLNLFTMAVLPALLEEMVYRGYILRTLRPYGNWFAVLVSSLLFSLMHGNLRQIPFAFIVGLVLGLLYVITDNIWLPITVHFANNAISVIMEYLGFSLSENAVGYFYALIIYGLTFVGAIALLVLFLRHRHTLRVNRVETSLPASRRAATLFGAPMFLISIILYAILLALGA